MLDNKRKAYIYRFVSIDNRTLYVGKCIDLNKRMKNHWSKNSHLYKNGKGDLYNKVQRIEYIPYKTELEALHKELEYINYYKPPYNTMSKIKQVIDAPDDINKWKVYRVLKQVPEHDAKLQQRREKLMPILIATLYIAIILTFMLK
ncbi:MAG: nucleotide excision repair endonuclease [Romboutsia timonensis]|uniref:nucleotide excision repair endonuclease n=1 Tax=Romboutsia timonensis TaxID=1776391 RepID=UPI002A75BC3F|nr:nucleotide excision repair endonuclease [Romboutsia timonensis]MDY2882989.1 nucleotide excision repair endonuclease [Romboutsia timonensis]